MLWFVSYEITTKRGNVIRKDGKVTSPANHFAEFMRRFHPTAVKITWWPTGEDHKTALGEKRTVEFDAAGKVTRRIPDHDGAHVGRADFQVPPGLDWNKPGTSRAGLHPQDQPKLGWHPRDAAEEEEEAAPTPAATAAATASVATQPSAQPSPPVPEEKPA